MFSRLLLSLSLAALGLGASLNLLAADPPTESWIAGMKREADTRLAECMTARKEAERVVRQAEEALDAAQRASNDAAEGVARQAVASAAAALKLARDREALATREVEAFAAARRWPELHQATAALALHQKGGVERMDGTRWIALDPRQPLGPGATVRTDGKGRLELASPDGTRVKLGARTTIVHEKDNVFRLVEGVLHALKVKLRRGRRFAVRTPWFAVAVRGTEFEVVAGRDGDYLIPYEGTMIVTANKSAKAPDSPIAPMPEGVLARVESVAGNVSIERSGGAGRRAVSGDTIGANETITTGDEGSASLTLAGRAQATLDAGGRLLSARTPSHAPMFSLRQGRLVVQSSRKEAMPILLTPNAVIGEAPGQIEIRVNQRGLSEVRVLSGTFEVSARSDKLDLDGIAPWWRQP